MQTLSSCTGVFNCELIDAGIYPLLLAPQVRQRTLGKVRLGYLPLPGKKHIGPV